MNILGNRSDNDLMKKVQALQREFAEIDIDHDSRIRREELYAYLDRKSGASFDRAVADEIFEHMDADQNNNVTVNEFIKVYIEAEEMLMKKIEATKNNLQNYRIQEEDCLKKADEERFQERSNTAAHSSIVHVTVLEGNFKQPIGLGGPSNPYVEISLDDQQRVRTKSVLGGQNAVWDEQVTLDVLDPASILRFIVFDTKNMGDHFEGEIAVQIGDLGDQSVHDVLLNLFDETGQREIGKLHVNLQWIHSKATYYEMLAKKWAENYSKEQEDLREYERYLGQLYLPFPALRTGQDVNIASQSAPTLLDQKVLGLMTKAARNITKENPSSTFWEKILTLGCVVELLLAIFISFGRNTSLEILLSLAILLELRHAAVRNIIPLKRVAIVILVSAVFYDMIWLAIYSGNWTNIESYDISAEKGTRSFTVFFSYVNILVKILLGIICYTYSLHISG